MASRTRTVVPKSKTNVKKDQPSETVEPDGQPSQAHHASGFTVVKPNAERRQKIANAAAREEAHIRQHHAQRRREVIQMMNHNGPTAHRLGGDHIDMAEVRKRQVEKAEEQLRKAKHSIPVSKTD